MKSNVTVRFMIFVASICAVMCMATTAAFAAEATATDDVSATLEDVAVVANSDDEKAVFEELGWNYFFTGVVPEGIEWTMERDFYFREGEKKAYEASRETVRSEMEELGWNYFFTGEIPEGIEWDMELTLYFEEGVKKAHDSGKMQAYWEQCGYDFVAYGKALCEIDDRYADEQLEYIQRGIRRALAEKNVVDYTTIKALENFEGATPEEITLEGFRRILSEGWIKLGADACGDPYYFMDKNLSSVYDSFFSSRGMGMISASGLIQVGWASAK